LREERGVEVDTEAKVDVIQVCVPKVVPHELVRSRPVGVSTVEDDAAQPPREPAVDEIRGPCEPAVEIGIDELATLEPHLTKIADPRTVEAAVAKQRVAICEWEPLTRTVGKSSRRRREITVGPVSSSARGRPAGAC
jgi:hypothetical protein